MKGTPEHNDPHWCGRIAYTALGVLLVAMDLQGLRAVFTEHRFAFLGCVFLILGFMSHIIFGMKQAFLKSLNAITDGIENEMNPPNQASHATSEPAPGAASSAREG